MTDPAQRIYRSGSTSLLPVSTTNKENIFTKKSKPPEEHSNQGKDEKSDENKKEKPEEINILTLFHMMKDLAQNQIKSQKTAEESDKKLDMLTNLDHTKVVEAVKDNTKKVLDLEEKQKEQEEELQEQKKKKKSQMRIRKTSLKKLISLLYIVEKRRAFLARLTPISEFPKGPKDLNPMMR